MRSVVEIQGTEGDKSDWRFDRGGRSTRVVRRTHPVSKTYRSNSNARSRARVPWPKPVTYRVVPPPRDPIFDDFLIWGLKLTQLEWKGEDGKIKQRIQYSRQERSTSGDVSSCDSDVARIKYRSLTLTNFFDFVT